MAVGAAVRSSSALRRGRLSSARTGSTAPGHDQRGLRPHDVDEHRCEHGAEPERREQEPLEGAEGPAQDVVGDGALHDRQGVHVDDRVPDADDREGDHRDHGDRDAADQREREPEEREPQREVAGQPPAGREEQRDEPADEPADADGGVEEADAGVVEVEELEGGDDDEHVERAGDEGLGRVEPDERAERRLAHDRPDPGEQARCPARPRPPRAAPEAARDRAGRARARRTRGR